MKNIYDNGALMLGNVQDLIIEIESEKRENIDMLDTDMDELLKDLKELKNIDYEMVVCINYENFDYQGYSLDYWSSKDIVKKGGDE